jgi:hypothetical protein
MPCKQLCLVTQDARSLLPAEKWTISLDVVCVNWEPESMDICEQDSFVPFFMPVFCLIPRIPDKHKAVYQYKIILLESHGAIDCSSPNHEIYRWVAVALLFHSVFASQSLLPLIKNKCWENTPSRLHYHAHAQARAGHFSPQFQSRFALTPQPGAMMYVNLQHHRERNLKVYPRR